VKFMPAPVRQKSIEPGKQRGSRTMIRREVKISFSTLCQQKCRFAAGSAV